MELGFLTVLACTILVFPIILTIARAILGDALLAYSGIIGYLIIVILLFS